MCGIAGIVGLNGLSDPAATMRRMTDALAHRGPDAEGVHIASDVVLGHRRLSIIDLSHAADQPFRSPDGRYAMVFNGEIYNYRSIRAELNDFEPRTNGDTEVLLAAYVRWGDACLHRLRGMFAFAIWDDQEQELFLARDRIGIKPLYYHDGDAHFIFASELRALLASDRLPRALDRIALADLMRYQTVHAPATLVRDVHMLRPGHWMRVSGGEVHMERWYDLAHAAETHAAELPLATIHREVRERFTRAVEERLVADVPFGAFLSGGIDSSAVVGAMAQVSTDPVHTFTVTFDESAYSEARYADIIARRFRTEHTEIRARPDDLLRALPDALAAMDHPSVDGPNTWLVSRETRRAGITMALSGLGGDELFAGYPVFARTLALWDRRWVTQFPVELRRLVGLLLRLLKRGPEGTKAAELLGLPGFSVDDTYPISRLAFTDRELSGLMPRSTSIPNAVRSILHDLIRTEEAYALPFLSQVSLAELSTYLPNILLRDTDQMSMAHALEVRVPFLDHDLIGLVLGVDDARKYPHTPKQLLTDALGDLLPRVIIDRPKMGFTLPWEDWMRNELRSFCAAKLQALGARDLLEARGIDGLWSRFLARDRRVNWARIWFLVVLEDWLDRNAIQ
ncbi:MAG: asparagine synthase (glutamine-hydrolyzing) [Flavobacteriales bacterium]|nr:asparagine synthase (glutamine-hydrolyzing) [Flavobacteriales bacterium]MCB9166360.1 asparagine synthase (glutamine-hydrolyzing) [Flavobacteriales bacterium]